MPPPRNRRRAANDGCTRIVELLERIPDRDCIEGWVGRHIADLAVRHPEAMTRCELHRVLADIHALESPTGLTRRLKKPSG